MPTHFPLMERPTQRVAARSSTLHLDASAPTDLAVGIEEVRRAFPSRFTTGDGSTAVHFESLPAADRRLVITPRPEGDIVIGFSRPADAFRALGILMGQLESGLVPIWIEQQASFESLGVMLDVSRNGVLRIEAVRKLVRHLALMGINQLMLYTEDTYEIPGEPLFGYFRGGYTREELSGIDAYAALFGIEVVPCIQTLGHLEQVLQWPPYQKLQDTAGVILADDPATDAFVEKMIVAAAAPFRSRRIHIGMDEATVSAPATTACARASALLSTSSLPISTPLPPPAAASVSSL